MKYFIFTILLSSFLLFSCISTTGQALSEIRLSDLTEFELVWSDEFDYQGLPDKSKWNYDTGGFGWWNNELQNYTKRKENARVEDGLLIIEAHKEDYKEGAKTNHYTSARLKTKYKGDWLYGRIEVRAQLPHGNGIWPAIWMMPTKEKYGGWPNSGEIDIMEHVGYEPDIVHFTIHTSRFNHRKGTQKSEQITLTSPHKTFHTYGIEWQEDSIIFFVDDRITFVFPKMDDTFQSWPFNDKFYIILNIAVGGDWGGARGIDTSIFPQQMKVDYVRVYQKKVLEASGY